MNLTKRSHYNPCAWTALWNERYFHNLVAGTSLRGKPRQQVVHALSVRSGTIRQTTVERVHYDEGIGTAEMSSESMKDFCRRRFPEDYPYVAQYINENPETLIMDFEHILRSMEEMHGVRHLIHAAATGGFSSVEHKGFIACLLIIHAMRSHEFMTGMLDRGKATGMTKWEYFWLLKNAWGNRLVLARAVTPLGLGRWTLYRTSSHRFPLCDSPVMINRDNVMMLLSPRLLLEIDLTTQKREHEWFVREGISSSKYREFRRRSIQNTFKDILFSDRGELEEWRRLPEFKARMQWFDTRERESQVTNAAAQRVGWALYGFGRVPDDFEQWIEPVLDAAPSIQG